MNILIDKKLPEKIYKAILNLSSSEPFYFYTFLYCNFIKDSNIETCGCNFIKGKAYIYYNENFLTSKSVKDIEFIIIHELDHLLSRHIQRTIDIKANNKLANFAQDIIINENIKTFQNYIIPTDGLSLKDLEKPILKKETKYEGKLIFEELYYWLKENIKQDNNLKLNFDNHIEDIKTTDIDREMFKNEVINSLKNRGFYSGNIEEKLNNIIKQKEDYLRYIKSCMQETLSGKNKKYTWSKLNRKRLPLKGYNKTKNSANVILDVSASMSGEHEFILGYLYRNNYEFNLLQVDTEVNCINSIKNKSALKKLKLKGFGGTELQPGINYLIDKKKDKQPLIILTDGYCDKLNFLSYSNKNILIISTGIDVSYNGKIKKLVKAVRG